MQKDLQWIPEPGPETEALFGRLKGVSSCEKERIREESIDILGRCIPPSQSSGCCTGLVIGYVQSGKTMSFTSVAALARDNGYRMIIIVGGTKVPLLKQSEQRLMEHLDVGPSRPWRHFSNPKLRSEDHLNMGQVLDLWENKSAEISKKKTILITVMKHHTHLANLTSVLRKLQIQGVPVLIIDDEADHASLNTKVREQELSTTYARLLDLKNTIPHHSFLQYTATPQAMLLINIVDMLSPAFAEVISPGNQYVGGKEYFLNSAPLVCTISEADIGADDNQLQRAPESLRQALRIFLLGAAAHTKSGQKDVRSMMVHPSQRTGPHQTYHGCVKRFLQALRLVFNDYESPAWQEQALAFQPEYEELKRTVPNLPVFNELIKELPTVLAHTRVIEVNARKGQTEKIDWNASEYWILVGGQAFDRGFTVEGLTVTYMPRSVGEANADTLQQRARFFGYKSKYKGYCRVFLTEQMRFLLTEYVDHEEDVRAQLLNYRGRPLLDWKREFFLNGNMKPTRSNVIDIDYERFCPSGDWIVPQGMYDSSEVIQKNRMVFENFIRMVDQFSPFQDASQDFTDLRVSSKKNRISRAIPLKLLQAEFLTRIRVSRLEDSNLLRMLLRLIQVAIETNERETVTVVLIANYETQYRSIDDSKIKQVFQGRQPNEVLAEELRYVGDREIYDRQRLTLHLRRFDLGKDTNVTEIHDVPIFAVRVPPHIAKDVLTQQQDPTRFTTAAKGRKL